LLLPPMSHAAFVDEFDIPKVDGWMQITGDGNARMGFEQKDGFARIHVDATQDKDGVWWTCIKRDVTRSIDVKRLKDPAYELRVEAKVRGSAAPRRVNFMLNTSRTTDFHEHLREYYLDDTTSWHIISFTTKNFDAVPGDTVFAQFCVTDWGPGQYNVDLDYYKADVVRPEKSGPDLGEPLIYHPPIAAPSSFKHHVPVTHDSIINSDFPDVNFNDWHIDTASGSTRVLTVTAGQWIVLRWDFDQLKGAKAAGAGVLELTTHSLAIGGKYIEALGKDFGEEFGKVHVIEILGGDPAWDQEKVTYNNLTGKALYEEVFNTQMIIDLEMGSKPGEKAYFTLPRPVMQRLLDGKTKGLLIKPLGALSGSVYASEDGSGNGPKLHFNTAE
jgi:hypothetical protein